MAVNPTLEFSPKTANQAWQDRTFKVYTHRQLDKIPALKKLGAEQVFEMEVVANVLPFRVNEYVIEELIDWNNIPDDPIFRLVFPQKEMLPPEGFERMAAALKAGDKAAIAAIATELRADLNPHPAGQMELNVPELHEEKVEGTQHKYRETVLFFPSQGQVCHSYCTFCFRWAQFVGDKELRFASNEVDTLHQYLRDHEEVSDLLMTGGDPMVMKTKNLAQYLEPIADDATLEHVQTIRIGTKSLTFWPYRFVTDPDADAALALFEKLVKAGKHVAIMAHYNHWKELDTPIAREAIRRVRATGAEIRAQGPLLNHINNDPDVWSKLWREQVKLGIIPYYMFVERDTGARQYFEIPLAQAWDIYRNAMKNVSGLGRTARGPSMSADPGKVEIQGVTEIKGEKVFVLRFIQGRNPDWVQRPFFAKYDENATWLHHLKPAFGEEKFFFEDEFEAMKKKKGVA